MMKRKSEANRQGQTLFEMMLEPIQTELNRAFVSAMGAVNQLALTLDDSVISLILELSGP